MLNSYVLRLLVKANVDSTPAVLLGTVGVELRSEHQQMTQLG